jgi:hypothetical protein
MFFRHVFFFPFAFVLLSALVLQFLSLEMSKKSEERKIGTKEGNFK